MRHFRYSSLSGLALVFLFGLSAAWSQAPEGGGAGARDAARAAQLDLEKNTPQLKVKEEVLPLSVPGHTIGETEGVSMNAQGHLFVYSRTGSVGIARGGAAAELFEFDQNLKFVKLWGPGNYAASFAHSVRVDRHGNIWMIDEGSNMIVKFDPQGNVSMVLGRKMEAIDYLQEFVERGEKNPERHPAGVKGQFNRETDVAWDEQDNIYVADGYTNSRVVKISPDGEWLKMVGSFGSGQDQFNIVHSIAYAQGNVYVADRTNNRIQVYDKDLNFKKTIGGVGAPWGVCVTPGPNPVIYSGDGNTGKLYKLDLDGKLLGWAQTSQHQGQSACLIHEIHCESANVVYRGSCGLWNVEKITIQ
jgi:hypothetical protein